MNKVTHTFAMLRSRVLPPQASILYKALLVVALLLFIFNVSLAGALLVSNIGRQTPVAPESNTGSQPGKHTTEGRDRGADSQDNDKDEQADEEDDDANGSNTGPGSSGNGSGGGSTNGSGDGSGNGSGGSAGNGSNNGSGGSTGSCALPNYPNDSCTGVPGGTSLTTHSGDYTAQAGEVIDGMRITGKLFIDGNNVTVRNSEVYGEVKNPSMPNSYSFSITDSTIGAPSGSCKAEAAIGHNNYTMERVYLRNYGEGPRIEEGGDVIIRDSYLKFCDPGGEAHSDGIQGYLGGSNILIQHNTIDQSDVSIDTVTSNLFWSDESGNNLQLKDNLLLGGGFTIRIHSGTGHTVSGNRVVNNSWYFGPVSSDCGAISWSDNRLVTINSSYQVTDTLSAFDCAE